MSFFRNNIFIWYATFFIVAVFFNFAWEFSQANLYEWLPPMEKTAGHLFWFGIKDAFFYLSFALVVSLFFRSLTWYKEPKIAYFVLLAFIGFIFSVFIEYDALNSARWAYLSSMPLIPILNVGLTPILQMTFGPLIVVWLMKLCVRSDPSRQAQ